MKQVFAVALAVLALAGVAGRAVAFPQFGNAFKAKYVGENPTGPQQALAAAMGTAKCNLCHDPKKGADGKESKKNRNPYGQALDQLLGPDDKSNAEKIAAALVEVEGKREADGKPTFGELIKGGKLPYTFPQ